MTIENIKCGDCNSKVNILQCSKCNDLYCKECNQLNKLFFQCYICPEITCEKCNGDTFCDFCGCQDNFICENHVILVDDTDLISCTRPECMAVAEYLGDIENGDEYDDKRYKELLKSLSLAAHPEI